MAQTLPRYKRIFLLKHNTAEEKQRSGVLSPTDQLDQKKVLQDSKVIEDNN